MTSRRELERRPGPGVVARRWESTSWSDTERATFTEHTRACMAAWDAQDMASYTRAFTALVEDPVCEPVVGIGWVQHHHARRVDPGPQARQGVHEGAGRLRLCFPT